MEIIASHKLEVIRIVCGERRAGEKSKVTLYWTDSWLRLAATEQSNRRENIGVHLIFRLNKQNRPPCERRRPQEMETDSRFEDASTLLAMSGILRVTETNHFDLPSSSQMPQQALV